MDFEQNKVSQDDLENVSGGGEIIETKDGKFIWTPHPIKKFYDKKEDAEKAEKALKSRLHIRKPGGHDCGPGCRHRGPHDPLSQTRK